MARPQNTVSALRVPMAQQPPPVPAHQHYQHQVRQVRPQRQPSPVIQQLQQQRQPQPRPQATAMTPPTQYPKNIQQQEQTATRPPVLVQPMQTPAAIPNPAPNPAPGGSMASTAPTTEQDPLVQRKIAHFDSTLSRMSEPVQNCIAKYARTAKKSMVANNNTKNELIATRDDFIKVSFEWTIYAVNSDCDYDFFISDICRLPHQQVQRQSRNRSKCQGNRIDGFHKGKS